MVLSITPNNESISVFPSFGNANVQKPNNEMMMNKRRLIFSITIGRQVAMKGKASEIYVKPAKDSYC